MSILSKSRPAPAPMLLLAGALATALPACSSYAATAGAATKAASAVTIGFDKVTTGAFTHYAESGFALKAPVASHWTGSTGYGNPAPFIEFNVPANSTTIANLSITQKGATFTFTSVDLYASDNPVSYEFKGYLKGVRVYADGGNTGNLYGQFRTFFNTAKHTKTAIDKLEIRITDANSIGDVAGLDNIVLIPGAKAH